MMGFKSMRQILLARHGETDWNCAHRMQGHADVPLNETGRAQAKAAGARLAGLAFGAVYASPLQRARHGWISGTLS